MSKKQPAGLNMTPSRTELGSFIRTRRLELRIRQVRLAKKIGIKQSAISLIEIGGRKYLNEGQLKRLAKVLRIDPEELRKRMPVKPGTQPMTELGQLVRSRRQELGLSHVALSKKLKITPRQAKRLETEKRPYLSPKLVKPLAKTLYLDASSLTRFVKTVQRLGQNLGRLVRARRMELGMGIQELAEKLGVSKSLVSAIELGRLTLSRDNRRIAQLAQVLEIDVKELEAVRPITVRRIRRRERKEDANPLGEFLAAKRTGLHLTQREVAQRAGISKGTVCLIEVGQISPSPRMLEKLAKVLGCEVPRELYPTKPSKPRKSRHAGYPLGEFLATKRWELGLTQHDAALRAGTTENYVCRIETGRLRPNPALLDKLAKAMQCKVPRELYPAPPYYSGSCNAPRYRHTRISALGKLVTERRLELGLTQPQLAQKAGISLYYVMQAEHGGRLYKRILDRLFLALDCVIPAELIPPPDPGGSQDVPRLPTIPLSDQDMDDLIRIKELSGIRVDTEAVRRALKLLRRLLEKQSEGYGIALRKDDNVVGLELL